MRYLRYILVFALMVLGLAKVGAQNDRNFIRQGNRAYHKQKWAAAETQYRKAISKNQKNAQAVYNLGCALMMQQKDSMAMIQFENASKLETNKMRCARSYHNMGVVMQQHQHKLHCRAIFRDVGHELFQKLRIAEFLQFSLSSSPSYQPDQNQYWYNPQQPEKYRIFKS